MISIYRRARKVTSSGVARTFPPVKQEIVPAQHRRSPTREFSPILANRMALFFVITSYEWSIIFLNWLRLIITSLLTGQKRDGLPGRILCDTRLTRCSSQEARYIYGITSPAFQGGETGHTIKTLIYRNLAFCRRVREVLDHRSCAEFGCLLRLITLKHTGCRTFDHALLQRLDRRLQYERDKKGNPCLRRVPFQNSPRRYAAHHPTLTTELVCVRNLVVVSDVKKPVENYSVH